MTLPSVKVEQAQCGVSGVCSGGVVGVGVVWGEVADAVGFGLVFSGCEAMVAGRGVLRSGGLLRPGWLAALSPVVVAALVAGVVGQAPVASAADPVSGVPVIPKALSVSAAVGKGADAGYLPSSGEVLPSGVFTTSVPLDVPAGRAAMSPRLSLQYASGAGRSSVGVGWSLSGAGSAIARCAQSVAVDGTHGGVHFDPNDRFCLNGERLILVGAVQGGTDKYGGDGSEYRTRSNSFRRIVAFGGTTPGITGPDRFEVTDKKGVTQTFLPHTATRSRTGVGFDTANNPLMDTDLAVPVRVTWLLDHETDASGNTVSYEYDKDGRARNEILISKIEYTSNGGVAAKRRVEFDYEDDAAGARFSYTAGVRFAHTKRLKTIRMLAPMPDDTKLAWQYHLAYTVSSSRQSLLASLQKCGSAGGCVKKKEFGWSSQPAAPSFTVVDGGSVTLDTAAGNPRMRVLDLDGDGRSDLLYSRGPGKPDRVKFGVSPDAQRDLTPALGWPGELTDLGRARAVDANVDGAAEILLPVFSAVTKKWTSHLLKWDKKAARFVEDMMTPFDLPENAVGNLADVNGDGRLDMLSPDGAASDKVPTVSVRIADGPGTFKPATASSMKARCDLGVSDLDGDGRAEQLSANVSADGTCLASVSSLSVSDAGVATVSAQSVVKSGRLYSRAAPQQSGFETFPGDFNADGLEDVLLLPPKTDPAKHIYDLHGILLFNTGRGLADPHSVSIGHDDSMDLRVADVNGDGRDDIVSFDAVATHLAVSDGDGTFTSSDIDLGGGTKDESAGRATSQLADVNGDGRTDVVKIDSGRMRILQQNERQVDKLVSVHDEGVAWQRESITYSNTWSSTPETATCTYPLTCPKKGFPVVRQRVSRAGQVNTASAGAARVWQYTYADPVTDLRGNGSLGFGTFRVFDKRRASQTEMVFAHRKSVSNGAFYPEVGRPSLVTTVVAILTAEQAAAKPATARARVTRTSSAYEARPQHGGKVMAVFDTSSTTKEWEQSGAQQVAIDWDGQAAGAAITGVSEPATALRRTDSAAVFDEFGNPTSLSRATDGGTALITTTKFDTAAELIEEWRVGEALSSKTVSFAADGATRERNVSYLHDERGLLTRTDVEKNNTDDDADRVRESTITAYNARGAVTSVTSKTPGRPDRTVYTAYEPAFPGQPNEEIYPSLVWVDYKVAAYRPATWMVTHPAFGITLGSEDVNGRTTTAKIDDLGRQVHAETDGTAPTDITYAGRGDLAGGINGVSVTTTTGPKTSTASTDVLGRPVASFGKDFDNVGGKLATAVTYDTLGRTVATSAPSPTGGKATSYFEYDSLDRMVKSTGPDGKSTVFEPAFASTTVTDPTGATRLDLYDADGRLKVHTDYRTKPDGSAEGLNTAYTYAPFDLLKSITDAKGNVTTMQYDVRGRRTRLSEPDRGVTDTAYFGNGLIERETRGDAQHQSVFGYDDLGRMTSRTTEDGISAFVYDSAPHGIGQLDYATSPEQIDKIRTDFTYDSYGRPAGTTYTDQTTSRSYTTSQTYNADGTADTLTYPEVTGREPLTLRYGYNAAGYPNTVTDITPGQDPKTLWTVSKRTPDLQTDTAQLGNGVTLKNTYQSAGGRLDTLTATTGAGTKVMGLDYDYDAAGRVIKQTRDDATTPLRSETYDYNTVGQLTGWNLGHDAGSQSIDYSYDALGGLTKISQPDGTADTLTYPTGTVQPHTVTGHDATSMGGAKETYGYDNRGRQTTVKNAAGTVTRQVTYTAFDLPRTVTTRGVTTTYRYDAFNNKIMEATPIGNTLYIGGLFEHRFHKGSGDKDVFHLAGPDGSIGQAVFDGVKTDVQYNLTDRLGSTATTLDTSGNPLQTLYYEPFGRLVTKNGTPFTGTTGDLTRTFTGHENTPNTGLINMKGRLYDPNNHTFITPDPVLDTTTSQTLNPYTYVHNDPLNNTDPSGKVTCAFTHPGECDQPGSGSSGIAGAQSTGAPGVYGGKGYIGNDCGCTPVTGENSGSNAEALWNQANAADKAAIEAADRAAAKTAKADAKGSTQAGSGDILNNTTAAAGLCTEDCATDPVVGTCYDTDIDCGTSGYLADNTPAAYQKYEGPNGLNEVWITTRDSYITQWIGVLVVVGGATAVAAVADALIPAAAPTVIAAEGTGTLCATNQQCTTTVTKAVEVVTNGGQGLQKIVTDNGGPAAAEIRAAIDRGQAIRQTISAMESELERVQAPAGRDLREFAAEMGFSVYSKYWEYHDELVHSIEATKKLLP
ncbi:FG-GAP-like repeat-containing protein [Streptomyces sp. NBC_00289]|uniref:FG-GAP-like repeat-containing protein n=1 Tax=Streptomyces sp. NBC_00289 TaxID=2975703 RepID=UPI00352EA0F0